MTRSFKPWLLLTLVFLAGVTSGVIGTRIAVRMMWERVRSNPDHIRTKVERDLKSELDLTPDQEAHVKQVVARAHERLRKLRSEVQPRFVEVIDEAHREIAENLTPEQREKFREFARTKRLFWGLSGGEHGRGSWSRSSRAPPGSSGTTNDSDRRHSR